jgi:integrase
MLRELAAMRRPTVALPLAEILRATGLRSGQGLALVVGDLVRGPDGSPGLHVPAGKSRREQEEDRVVPIAPVLAPLLAALAAEAEAEGRTHLVPFHGSVAGGRRTSVARTFRGAWEAATARGEARRDVWDPPKRGQARPVHALRAGLQAELLRAGVAEAVVKALVGHAGGLAGGHYVSVEDRWAAMRAAVATIPPIWWG